MRLYPLHDRLVTAYRAKHKWSGNQHQGLGIDGERRVKSVREKIIQAEKETPCGIYDTPRKDRAKLVIDTSLNTTPTTKDHWAVATLMKKSKREVDATPTTNNVCLEQVGDL